MTLLDRLLTPDRRAEAAEFQARQRPHYTAVLNKPAALVNYEHGQAREASILNEAARWNGQEATAEDVNQMADRLSEALALQGRFAEAAEMAADKVRQGDYAERARAMEFLGLKLCACPPEYRVASLTDAKGTRIEALHPIEEVWDADRGRVITILRCRLCGVLSAR